MLAIGFAAIDSDSGLGTWWRLRGDHAEAQARIDALERRIAVRRAEARRLEGNPLAQERAIREDLGFARPGETVVRLPRREALAVPSS